MTNRRDSERFLRSPELRAYLYYSAEGRCRSCGAELEEGWHADHIIPWSIIRRTNVFEMEALCRQCNLKKGANMVGPNNIPPFEISEEAFRPGQRNAYLTIVDRVRRGERYTAVVLPTRYGKTDVMRVAGLRLWRDRLVSRFMIMAPDKILRDQTIQNDKVDACLRRYGMHSAFPGGLPVCSVERPSLLRQSAPFWAITTQMANQHLNILTQWVKHAINRMGLPPVVFVDEAHTTSDENRWGNTMGKLGDAGAFIVLMTATPYRSDNNPIPGFDLIPESTHPVRILKPKVNAGGEDAIDIYEGIKTHYRLEAHHITTFRQAWDEEVPSPLCKITRRTFEVNLSEVDSLTGEFTGKKLSQLAPRETRRALMPALKDLKIIREACDILVGEVASRRLDENGKTTAAIVFVGNDAPNDPEVNQHAEDVKLALNGLAPSLRCAIATSGNPDDAAETIADFAAGKGDVLIVKQMAGRGLDIDRLKVCLDLSNVRTPASFVQRMTRVCTVWEHGSDPEEAIRTATYIAPDDCLGTALFQRFVTDEGGDAATITDLEHVDTILASGRQSKLPSVYIAESVGLPTTFEDTQQEKAPGEMIPTVDNFRSAFPALDRVYSQPEIANKLLGLGIPAVTSADGNDEGEPPPPVSQEPAVRNLTKDLDQERKRLNAVAKKLINKEFISRFGRPYQKSDGRLYRDLTVEIWTAHKQRVGLSPGLDIKDITDVEKLREMHRNMTVELQNG